MNDVQKTLAFVGVAAVLTVGAAFRMPRHKPAESFGDQGKAFYPDFTDPMKAAALEVVEFDEPTATARPFKVEFRNGKWIIPSHHNYPADAKDRLARTAASVIDLKRDVVRSDREKDHEAFGVIDPLDANEKTPLKGRGKRVTLRDAEGKVLADFILGKETRDGSGQRYVRLPDQKRVYGVKTRADVSGKFADWIETDLLKCTASTLRRITIDNYSVDEQEGKLINRQTYALARDDGVAAFKLFEMTDKEEINTENVTAMTGALDDLRIVGVRRKPDAISRDLRINGDISKISQATAIELQRRGFFVTRQGIFSNEGEIEAKCDDGVVYTLRFGEVLFGHGDEVTSGAEPKDPKKEGSENRYLFATAGFDEGALGVPPAAPPPLVPDPAWTEEQKKQKEADHKIAVEDHQRKKKEFDDKFAAGKKRAQELTDRFADWYYVISADYFKKLRKGRADLVKPKEEKKPDEPKKPEDPHKHDHK